MANASTLEKYTDLPEAPYNAERGALLVYLLKNRVEAALFLKFRMGCPPGLLAKILNNHNCDARENLSFLSLLKDALYALRSI